MLLLILILLITVNQYQKL